jgi:hypothetical protein
LTQAASGARIRPHVLLPTPIFSLFGEIILSLKSFHWEAASAPAFRLWDCD